MINKGYLISLSAILITGCSVGESEIDSFIKNPGVKPGNVQQIPPVKKFPAASYDRNILPDPFSSRIVSVSSGKNGPNLERPRELLEKFGLDSLAMVGYLIQNDVSYALIKDPEGSVHRIKKGNYIGLNYGQITSVTKDGIAIMENIADTAGGWSTREANLYYSEVEQLSASGLGNSSSKGSKSVGKK